MPRTASSQLATTIAGHHAWIDLWTLEPSTGIVRWTNQPADVVIGATTWSATSPIIGRGPVRLTSGIEVSTLEIRLQGKFYIGGTTIAALAATGAFDDAKVTYQRAYIATPTTVPVADDLLLMFLGYVYEVDPSSLETKLVAKSILGKAEDELPRRRAGPMCPWTWGGADGRCGIVKATWQATDTVAGGSTAQSIVLVTGTSTFLVKGAILTFSDGQQRIIQLWTAGTKTAIIDSPLAGVPSGSVTIHRGCDKTLSTCNTVYANLARFGGFPQIPA